MLAEETLQVVQQANTVLATICSLIIHGYMICRLKSNYSVLTQYQNLLVAQSSTYFIASIFRLLVNRVNVSRILLYISVHVYEQS